MGRWGDGDGEGGDGDGEVGDGEGKEGEGGEMGRRKESKRRILLEQ